MCINEIKLIGWTYRRADYRQTSIGDLYCQRHLSYDECYELCDYCTGHASWSFSSKVLTDFFFEDGVEFKICFTSSVFSFAGYTTMSSHVMTWITSICYLCRFVEKVLFGIILELKESFENMIFWIRKVLRVIKI
jgi:hypothetical protein